MSMCTHKLPDCLKKEFAVQTILLFSLTNLTKHNQKEDYLERITKMVTHSETT